MDRASVRRISRFVPIAMSALALLVVLFALATGWDCGARDEGAAAHLWQILVLFQLPFVLAFLSTSDWRRARDVMKGFGLQVMALAAAILPVAAFNL